MKKLTILLIIAIALVGCGRESEQIDADASRVDADAQFLTVAWHKVTQDDGSICDLSTDTQKSVEQACVDLRQTLAPHGVRVDVKTLTPEKVDGADCLCNRVLIQGRYVDEWLGADMVKTGCSGCPNQQGCDQTAASGDGCGGQYEMVYRGKTYNILPANLIAMAGVVAASDLTGEIIAYSGCPGVGACEGDCTCGECIDGCKHKIAEVNCSPDCPGIAGATAPPCQAGAAQVKKTAATNAAKSSGCPRAAECGKVGCPSKASGN